ncbi:unnamed protein product [Lampetra planeri]
MHPLSLAGELDMQLVQLLQMLRDNPDLFAFVEGNGIEASGMRSNSTVLAVTSLRLCAKYRDPSGCPEGDSCQKLHMCRSYVLGNCKFGPRCRFSHDFRDEHNRDLCYENKVEGLPFDNIQKLLLPNDPSLLPQICNTYKVAGGNECEFNEKCTRLHLCKQFVLGSCKFGDNCRRNHNLNDRKIQILLQKFMLTAYPNDEVLKLLWKKEQIHIATRSSSTSVNTKFDKLMGTPKHGSDGDGDTAMENDNEEEICLYHLLSECQFKERCLKSHAKLPYRWQKRGKLARIWEDIPDMETIEKQYCDPTNVSWNSVDFVRMTMDNNAVRRLSTANAVTKPDNFLLTTKWIWYWQEDVGKWITYGSQATTNEKAKSEVSSGDLEKAYEKDKNGGLTIVAGHFLYHINFTEMMQTNMTVGTRRDVRRRPLFVSRRDVEAARERVGVDNIPTHWDSASLSEISTSLVHVGKLSAEYKEVESLFRSTVDQSFAIISIKRVQNLELWDAFQRKREWMRKKNGGIKLEERKLFHGTSPEMVTAICQQNFDWRLCGTHGTAYGKGSYFARDASYSHHYAVASIKKAQPPVKVQVPNQTKKEPEKGFLSTILKVFGVSISDDSTASPLVSIPVPTSMPVKMVMFLARVLVGRYTRGDSSYQRPPELKTSVSTSVGSSVSSSLVLYDSCVDTEVNPNIFVVFEKDQVYPEYVIDYTS